MGVFGYVRSQLDRRQMDREFKKSFKTLKQGYEGLDNSQLQEALRDMYDALFCVGTFAKQKGELVAELTVPLLPSNGYYVDRFENQMNALLAVIKKRYGLKEDPSSAAPAKYLDFKSKDTGGFGDHDPMQDGNPKLAQMEAKLLGYSKILNMDGMEKFTQWRDGINYGDNVQPAAWYWSHPKQNEPEQSALDKIRSAFPPDYYVHAFGSRGQQKTSKSSASMPSKIIRDLRQSSMQGEPHTVQSQKTKRQLLPGALTGKLPDR